MSTTEPLTKPVGFVNQNRGHVNSLLQSLFFIPSFRELVYLLPTENTLPTRNVACALQRIFRALETSNAPIETDELAQALLREKCDLSECMDLHQFRRYLLGSLRKQAEGTDLNRSLQRLFDGHQKSFIKCLDIHHQQYGPPEVFIDVQLSVKGMRSIDQSLQQHLAPTRIDYPTGKHGLQRAEHLTVYQDFPSILHISLSRLEYDSEHDEMVKCDDKPDFPLEMNVSAYLCQPADKSQSDIYKLHTVFLHRGDDNDVAAPGHHSALVRTKEAGSWFRFSDENVTPKTEREVRENQWGDIVGFVYVRSSTHSRSLLSFPIPSLSVAMLIIFVVLINLLPFMLGM